ncbi:MAG: hypothetical protein ABWX59_04010 [Microbacteriaceae bacterium]
MTATVLSPNTRTISRSGEFKRIWSVVRLHFVNPFSSVILPWMILTFIFAVNYIIWAVIYNATDGASRQGVSDGMQWSGSTTFIFVYMLVVAVQSVNLTFPFALGYSVTRRDFYLGTSLSFLIYAAMYGAGLTILSLVEDATDGWGLGGRMFTVVYFSDGPWFERLWVFVATFAFFLFIGAASAAVYVRWKTNGILVFTGILVLFIVAAVAQITLSEQWPAVGQWFVENGATGVVSWLLIPTAVAAVTGFFILRRATPKN